MDVVENQKKQPTNEISKRFNDSQLVLTNRKTLSVSGVEKVFEANQSKVQLQVSGNILSIIGQNLNITKLDVESGDVQVDGVVDELKYSASQEKINFFKKMFK